MAKEDSASPQLRHRRQYATREERRQLIEEAAIGLLAEPACLRISTRDVANKAGISEAGLFRHYPSKSDLLESLMEFIDNSIATMYDSIDRQDGPFHEKAILKMLSLLSFAEVNPGFARLMTGEVLVLETKTSQEHMLHILQKAEMAVKQTLKMAIVAGEIRADYNISAQATLMLNCVRGTLLRYTQSGFKERPSLMAGALRNMMTCH